ncbi:hypothetical protein SAMN05444392_102304 [Seinonella peptonophila]|uniref:Uncharacterized protein n=1 Tax=Seinonella peptonophila TaxID=112248 RepID=A0A1M4VDE0_9BACL|nr:hypothetical protein [Seinonella peptonophila]SHE66927.1 hypothetical protein SAMN05444392_102304 [Seinonella peptonophila]
MRKLPKDELSKLYLEDCFTYSDLAKHFKCSPNTILSNLELYRIPKLSKGNHLSRQLKLSNNELKELLYDLYWQKEMSVSAISDYLQSTPYTIWANLRRLGINRRLPKRKS